MVFILDTDVRDIQPIFFVLSDVQGIGLKRALLICQKLGFSKKLKLKNLLDDEIIQIVKLIHTLNFEVTSELSSFRVFLLKRLSYIKSKKGFRLKKGLPVRGQRTRTNAKSAKKK
jgi:small subunit ribosomal protein S13|uniref:Ribosomal protein S13 n=1 Tax=Asterionella formosa TaxID=210441 RepID=A0A1J0RDC1_9STRA|nr:ribosomal protein S13 [Asterionella formosa]APD75841.1 ribosomal protein S13 [Asterionella formosa]